jgi:Short C-terminal domain
VQQLTQAGNDAVRNLAQRYGVSTDAVTTLLFAVSNGGGSMAQFYHQELGGGGQWMRGGMTMVGDMFNHGLQALVANLCSELSNLLSSQQVFVPVPQYSAGVGGGFGGGSNNWWPGDLGSPSSSGGQNDSRYAYFPSTQRLAIDRAGHVTVYDALDHQIGGVQQQQGGSYGTLSFSSQFGTFTVDSLPVVSSNREPVQNQPPQNQPIQNPPFQNQPFQNQPVQNQPFQNQAPSNLGNPQSHDEILQTLERLSDLHQRGVLSEDEFRTKKSDLLSRL